MKKVILIFLLIIVYQTSATAQIENHNFSDRQKTELRQLSKVLSLIPINDDFSNYLENSLLKKIRKIESVDESGIKTTLIENWQDDAWVNYQLTTFHFDLNQNETGYLIQRWDNNNWVNSLNYGSVLNNNAYPERDSMQSWENNKWQNFMRHFYSYNSNNDVTTVLTQMWNDTTKVWDNMMNIIFNYDDEYKITENYTETWSDTGWTAFEKEIYNYDSNDLCISRLSKMWMETEWMDLSRITYSYNAKDLLIEELNESWILFQSKWANSLRYQYEYNSNDQEIVKYDEEWDVYSGQQTVNKKISTTYTGDFISEELTQEWGDNDWVNTDLDTYTIEDNQITVKLWQKWDGVNDKWFNFQKWTNTYGSPVSVETEKPILNNYTLSQNYPNPFNPTTTIKYSIQRRSVIARSETTWQSNSEITSSSQQEGIPCNDEVNVTLKVYDVLGNELATLVDEVKPSGKYQVTFNAANLSSGVYYYQLQVGRNIITKKCLLIK